MTDFENTTLALLGEKSFKDTSVSDFYREVAIYTGFGCKNFFITFSCFLKTISEVLVWLGKKKIFFFLKQVSNIKVCFTNL